MAVNVDLVPKTKLGISLQGANTLNLSLGGSAAGGTRNYNNLNNRPQINGVTLAGDQSAADLRLVSENTAEGWADNALYVPKYGEICLYSDTSRIKIGDGVVPVVDLPFIGENDTQEIMDALREHANNSIIHVTAEDRARWDAKLNYTASGETLIFTRA